MPSCLRGGEYFGEQIRRQTVAGLLLTETRYAAGARVPRHSHERGYFCLVRRGNYREVFTGGQRVCGPQTLAYHPPGEWHAEEFAGAEARSFNVEPTPEWRQPEPRLVGQPFATKDPSTVALGMKMYREFVSPDAASALMIEGLTLELLSHVFREACGAERSPPAWLRRVRARLCDECVRPPRMTALADEANVHPGHLAAAFRRHFGLSAGEFTRRCRLERALALLSGNQSTLAEISTAAGFADQSHFTRCFRRQFGTTPGNFRRTALRSKT